LSKHLKIEAAAVHEIALRSNEDGVEKARAREALRGQSLQATPSESMATREATPTATQEL